RAWALPEGGLFLRPLKGNALPDILKTSVKGAEAVPGIFGLSGEWRKGDGRIGGVPPGREFAAHPGLCRRGWACAGAGMQHFLRKRGVADDGEGAVCPQPDGASTYRKREDGAVQFSVCPEARRKVHSPDR